MDAALIMPLAELPDDPHWLSQQSCPVIAYGGDMPGAQQADVIVADRESAEALLPRIHAAPIAALTLVQVLRSTEYLPVQQGLDVESLAYSTLQSGPEFAAWLNSREVQPLADVEGEAVLLSREGNRVDALLNRPQLRNSITVEMRDALVEALQLLEADTSIDAMHVRGLGACFSVGGELMEFGSLPDPATAHWVRAVRSPARMLARNAAKLRFHVHGACLGSGIELPAFAGHLVAHSKTYFQLPELKFGLIPGAGGTVSIARRIGRQRTAWMVLSGRRVNARTALEWGLVDEISDNI